jgi:hypothetical protein
MRPSVNEGASSERLPTRWWMVALLAFAPFVIGTLVEIGFDLGGDWFAIGMGAALLSPVFVLPVVLYLVQRGRKEPVLPLKRYRDRSPAVVERNERELDWFHKARGLLWVAVMVVIVVWLAVEGISRLEWG